MINFIKRVHYLKSGGLTLIDSVECALIVTAALWKIKFARKG